MKEAKKIFGVLLMGIMVTVVIYPCLHELGHSIAIGITGATLYKFRILPTPYVMYNGNGINEFENVFIGISGMLFPFVFSLLFNGKRFWMWLFSFYLKGISAFAFALSYIAVLCYESKIIWQNEDIVQVIQLSGISSSFWLVMMLLLFCLNALIIYFNKPFKRIEKFFEI